MTVDGLPTSTPLSLDLSITGLKKHESFAQTFTIANTGSVALQVVGGEVRYIDGSDSFIRVTAPCPPLPINPKEEAVLTVTVSITGDVAPGQSYDFQVKFRGTQANGGSWKTADVTINGRVTVYRWDVRIEGGVPSTVDRQKIGYVDVWKDPSSNLIAEVEAKIKGDNKKEVSVEAGIRIKNYGDLVVLRTSDFVENPKGTINNLELNLKGFGEGRNDTIELASGGDTVLWIEVTHDQDNSGWTDVTQWTVTITAP